MEERRQRRALAPRRDVPAAEIGHDIDPGQFCQQGRLAQLQGVAGAVEFPRAMAHGLAVRADSPHCGRGYGSAGEQAGHDVGVDPHQGIRCQCGPMQFVGAGSVQGQQLGAQRGGKRRGGVRHHDRTGRGEVGQDAVHAVKRRAGHEADVEVGHAAMLAAGQAACLPGISRLAPPRRPRPPPRAACASNARGGRTAASPPPSVAGRRCAAR